VPPGGATLIEDGRELGGLVVPQHGQGALGPLLADRGDETAEQALIGGGRKRPAWRVRGLPRPLVPPARGRRRVMVYEHLGGALLGSVPERGRIPPGGGALVEDRLELGGEGLVVVGNAMARLTPLSRAAGMKEANRA
jgi:hypothetical protein